MNDKPSFDRGLLIPIGVGVFSLVGICLILVVGRITALRGSIEEVPTATSFQYALIGTEPALVTAVVEDTLTNPPPADTEAPPPVTRTARPTSATVIEITPNATTAGTFTSVPTFTPTSASAAPLGAGTFDDLDARMIYTGDWNRQLGVSGAYKETLHVSNTVGNSVFFRFIGQEIRVFFQAGPSLGVIRLTLDGTDYPMSEASSSTQIDEWVLPSVANGTHQVTITHLSGGSVNIDYIIVPEVPKTPTVTATSSQ